MPQRSTLSVSPNVTWRSKFYFPQVRPQVFELSNMDPHTRKLSMILIFASALLLVAGSAVHMAWDDHPDFNDRYGGVLFWLSGSIFLLWGRVVGRSRHPDRSAPQRIGGLLSIAGSMIGMGMDFILRKVRGLLHTHCFLVLCTFCVSGF